MRATPSAHTALGQRISGHQPTQSSGATAALVPFDRSGRLGYQAHRFRSTLKQEVDRLVAGWQLENPTHPLRGYRVEIFSECLLDHTHNDLGYQDLRVDGDPTFRFEQIVAQAVELWWAELWGDGPYRRRGLDPDRIEAEHLRVRTIEAELEMLRAELTTLRQQSRTLVEGARTLRANEALMQALLESAAISSSIDDLVERRVSLERGLSDARGELEQACIDEVLVPEQLDDRDYDTRVASALARARDEPTPRDPPDEAPRAEQLTVGDIAELYGVSTQHVGRWRRGRSNPPIAAGQWIKVSEKDWRYPAAAIDAAALGRIPAADPLGVLDGIRRRRATTGFGRRRPQSNGAVRAAGPSAPSALV